MLGSSGYNLVRTVPDLHPKLWTEQPETTKCSSEGHLKVIARFHVSFQSYLMPIALALGECIGVFPEGTSHTEPHLIPLKDGTSWAALEYVRYLRGTEENKGAKKGRKAVIVPVGIAYVDKTKYRSRVVVQ